MRIMITVAVLILTGCATPPLTYNFDPALSYKTSKDIAWEGVMSFFSKNNIQIKTLEKDSGVVYAESMYTSAQSTLLDQYADCGKYPMFVPGKALVEFNVFVSQSPVDKEVNVRVNADFKKNWHYLGALGSFTETHPCNSKGTLEKSILNQVQMYIGSHQ